jgi:hypothetical protein
MREIKGVAKEFYLEYLVVYGQVVKKVFVILFWLKKGTFIKIQILFSCSKDKRSSCTDFFKLIIPGFCIYIEVLKYFTCTLAQVVTNVQI